MEKIGFFETYNEKTGTVEKSFMRKIIAWYFWAICFPASLFIVTYAVYGLYNGKMETMDSFTLLGYLFVLQLFWVAPKTIQKYMENGGLDKFLNNIKPNK